MRDNFEYILTIDTAMSGGSAGVYCGDTGNIVSRSLQVGRGQAEMLVPMVQEVVELAGIGFADIGLIVTTVGPGSFTGLRTGMSCARSFALALDIPLVGVNTFEVLVAAYKRDHEEVDAQVQALCVLVESRRAEFYVQFFGVDMEPSSEPLVIAQDDLLARMAGQKVVLIGDGISRFDGGDGVIFDEGYMLPDPLSMAQMAAARFIACAGDLPAVTPLYLRDADVSISKKPQRVLKV